MSISAAPFIQASTAVDDTAGGTTVLAASPRTFLLIQNIGANECYVTVDGSAPTTTAGVYLAALGGSITLEKLGNRKAIKAICSGSETTVVTVISS